MRELIFKIKHWWTYRWFRKNQDRLRNIAAWAILHHRGGRYDPTSILKGQADRRILEAANGRIAD